MKPFLHFDEISTDRPTYGTPSVVEAYYAKSLLYFIQQPVTIRIQQCCSSYNLYVFRLTLKFGFNIGVIQYGSILYIEKRELAVCDK